MKRSYLSAFAHRASDDSDRPYQSDLGDATTGGNDCGNKNREQELKSARSHPTSPTGSRDGICQECSKVDFAAAFARSPSSWPRRGTRISKGRPLHDLYQDCCLCIAAAQMIVSSRLPSQMWLRTSQSEVESRGKWHWRAISSSWCWRKPLQRKKLDQYETLVIAIRTPSSLSDLGWGWPTSSGFIASIDHLPSPCAGPKYQIVARPVQVHIPDEIYGDFRAKINKCRETHDSCRSIGTEWDNTLPLHAINCKTLKLEVIRPETEYLTLSYVWGGESPDNTCVEVADMPTIQLPPVLPQTIHDAVDVVLKLGHTFLWIDRYCIPNSKQKHEYILRMDQVYRGAWCTIVALSSCCVSDGLHGVSLPRNPSATIRIGGQSYIYTMPHLSRELLGKAWSTRGWCYQEAILSSRCLVLADSQVHLVCKDIIYQESFRAPVSVSCAYSREPFHIEGRDLWWEQNSRPSVNHPTGPGRSVYSLHIDHFSRRSLGYDVDGLNAIKGILAICPDSTYWGLPLRPVAFDTKNVVHAEKARLLCCRCAFAYSLAWDALNHSNRPSRRRDNFPSWAWPSMVSDISIHADQIPDCWLDFGKACPDIQVEISTDCWLTIEELTRRASTLPKVIDTPCRGLKITARWSFFQIPPDPEHISNRYAWRTPLGSLELSYVTLDEDEEHEPFVNRGWKAIELSRYAWRQNGWRSSLLIVDDCEPVCRRIGTGVCRVSRSDTTGVDTVDFPGMNKAFLGILEPPMEFHIE